MVAVKAEAAAVKAESDRDVLIEQHEAEDEADIDDGDDDYDTDEEPEIYKVFDATGMSRDEEKANLQAEAPGVEDWVDVDDTYIQVDVSRAVAGVWEDAKKEIALMTDSFAELFGTSQPPLEMIVHYMTGPRSELFSLFYLELKWSHPTFTKFLHTFFIHCAYRLSSTELYSALGYIEAKKLMPRNEYVALWVQLGEACLPDDEKASYLSNQETFWMKVENAINSVLRRFVVESLLSGKDSAKKMETVRVVFDDDKMHFAAKLTTALLKVSQHIRDNRKGPICHQAVLAASNLLVGFRFEREGDTAESSVRTIVKTQLAPAQGGDQSTVKNLGWLQAIADRGYQLKKLFFDFFMASGAKVNGTKKRSGDNPFSYGKVLKEGDRRTDIPLAGPKTMWIKKTVYKGRTVSMYAYRNGNGGVTLGTCSEAAMYEWDFVLKDPGNLNWYQALTDGKLPTQNILRLCFRPLVGRTSISDGLVNQLMIHPVTPMTTGQSSGQEWFILRGNSLSSRSVDAGFVIYAGNEEELEFPDSWAIAKAYVGKASGASRNWNDDDEPPTGTSAGTSTSSAETEVEGAYKIDLAKLISDNDYAAVVQADVHSGDCTVEIYRSVLVSLGAKVSEASTEQRRNESDRLTFLKWSTKHRHLRPSYFSKSINTLKQLASSLMPPCDLGSAATIPTVRNAIDQYLQDNPDVISSNSGDGIGLTSTADLSQRQRLVKAFLDSTYMRKLEGGEKKYARRGLDLEKPLAKKLLDDSAENVTIIKVTEIGTAPLVMRSGIGITSVVASADFVARADVFGTEQLVIIEVKGRVTDTSAAQTEAYLGLAKLRKRVRKGGIKGEAKYHLIKASDDVFPHFVTQRKEAIQLLHHAYVFDVSYVCLLIGDDHSRVLAGIWVEFDDKLKAAWGNVLLDMHRLSISFLYEAPKEQFVCDEAMKAFLMPVLERIKVGAVCVDLRSFVHWANVWRDIRLCWALPLPAVKHILPYRFSHWNATKGASDTISKFIWNAQYSPPTRLPQAHAVARMLLLLAIVMHRTNHIATAKKNLNYKSLMHFRVAACKRFSFFDTLLLIAKCLNPVSSSASDEDTETSTTADVASDEETTNPIGEVPAVLIATNSGGRNGEQATSKAVTFGAGPALGMTPKRNVKSQLSMMESKYTTLNKSKKMVINRRLHCTGIPLYSANIRGKCIQCERETKWWCAGCHVHCCIADTTDRATDIKYLDVKLPGHGSAEDMVVEGVRYSCYLQLHATAIMALPAFIEENRRGSV